MNLILASCFALCALSICPTLASYVHSAKNGSYYPPGELRNRQSLTNSDFVLKFSSVKPTNPRATGGSVRYLTTDNMKGLQSLSSALVTLKPCSISLPQYNPRASELVYVSQLQSVKFFFY